MESSSVAPPAATVEPMIRLDPGGKAPILSYNVPEPSSYEGEHFLELDFGEPVFADGVTAPFFVSHLLGDPKVLNQRVTEGMRNGFADPNLFPLVQIRSGVVRFEEKGGALAPVSDLPLVPSFSHLTPSLVVTEGLAGRQLRIQKTLYGDFGWHFVDLSRPPAPNLYLVERYRLSSFPGSYGAGRVLKTFTLLPGEKTRISIKSFQSRSETAKSASSVLDSFTSASSADFENTVASEQSDKQGYDKMNSYHAEAEAKASWGWGSAKVSGGVKGETRATREEFAKNVANALEKHAATASAKREVQVNTSTEVKTETTEETALEREIQNVNVSRTLNFVFRQMNQEFVSLLHLIDVRVAFFDGSPYTRREVALPQLDRLLEAVVRPDKRQKVREAILDQLRGIVDERGDSRSFIEELPLGSVTFPGGGGGLGPGPAVPSLPDRPDPGGGPGDTIVPPTSSSAGTYWRVRRNLVSTYRSPTTGMEVSVPGVIVTTSHSVMRTEGVIVEALLGQGEALDFYARSLQEIEVDRRSAEAARTRAEAEQKALINQLVRDNDAERAKVLASLLPPAPEAGAKP